MKLKVKPWILIIGGGILLIVFLGKFILFSGKSVPSEFSEARLRGAVIAQKIVTLADSAIKSLPEIAQYDKVGDTAQALILISRQLIENRAIQEEAVRLASQLEKMARVLPDIRPASARQVATAAVGAEVALVSRLISYNDYLKQLFEVLRYKFNSGIIESNGRVEDLIDKINKEAEAINDLNKRFNDSLFEFDKLFL